MPRCQSILTEQGPTSIDPGAIEQEVNILSEKGYRVIAVASGR
nr:hypothetical protein [Desulforamulus aquiferis]